MSEFYVGQKVVFVGTDIPLGEANKFELTHKLTKGAIYTIRWIGAEAFYHTGFQPAVRIAEVVRAYRAPWDWAYDFPYLMCSFRPVEEQSFAIKLCRRIAADATKHRKVTVREDA